MAAYNKFDIFVENLAGKVMDLLGTSPGTDCDVLKIALTNSAPVATNTVLANITEIANGNGYTTGGAAVTNNGTRATGTFTLSGTKVVWTGSGAGMGPFQYVVLYDDTPTSPADPLIGWWNHGSAVTLAAGETFTVKFNNGDPTGTILTIV